jgi:pSer/pThr/pTyr-binding forkhead associated (FHA) protein
MEDQKTVKMGSEAGAQENQPTVYTGGGQPGAGPSPFVRSALPGADQPTPRPGQPSVQIGGQPPAWPPVAAPPPAPWVAPQPGAPRADAATMLLAQRPTPVFAWLVVMDGPDKGRIHPLKPDTTAIGRAAGNDVALPDDTCSGQHLKIRIEPQENGAEQFVLIDLASRNGTYVGTKATYRDPASRVYRHVLQDGDYLLLGETTLVFKRV